MQNNRAFVWFFKISSRHEMSPHIRYLHFLSNRNIVHPLPTQSVQHRCIWSTSVPNLSHSCCSLQEAGTCHRMRRNRKSSHMCPPHTSLLYSETRLAGKGGGGEKKNTSCPWNQFPWRGCCLSGAAEQEAAAYPLSIYLSRDTQDVYNSAIKPCLSNRYLPSYPRNSFLYENIRLINKSTKARHWHFWNNIPPFTTLKLLSLWFILILSSHLRPGFIEASHLIFCLYILVCSCALHGLLTCPT
jgi:hypothetical protein